MITQRIRLRRTTPTMRPTRAFLDLEEPDTTAAIHAGARTSNATIE
jgi:hypothetical protein